MSKLVVLRAAPGTGKTTIANILHNESVEPTVLLPKDTFAIDMIKNHGDLKLPMKQAFLGAIRIFLRQENAIVITEGAFYSVHWHQSFQKLEKETDIDTFHFFLSAPLEIIRERARGRQKADVVTDEFVAGLHAGAQPLGWENETVIDTTAFESAHKVAEQIAATIGLHLDPNLEKAAWNSHSFLRPEET